MLKIRLQRVGKKHDPSFRVVLTDSRKSSKAGDCLELLGNYNPQRGEPVFKAEKIKEWLAKGAQPSDTVHNLFVNAKIIEGEKKDVLHHTKIAAKRAKKNPPAEKAPTPTLANEDKVGAPTPADVGEVEAPQEEAPVAEEAAAPVEEVKEEAPATGTPTSENVGEEAAS